MLVPCSQHVFQSKRAVECAQAIVFIRHESRYLIVPDSKVHHGVSKEGKMLKESYSMGRGEQPRL